QAPQVLEQGAHVRVVAFVGERVEAGRGRADAPSGALCDRENVAAGFGVARAPLAAPARVAPWVVRVAALRVCPRAGHVVHARERIARMLDRSGRSALHDALVEGARAVGAPGAHPRPRGAEAIAVAAPAGVLRGAL